MANVRFLLISFLVCKLQLRRIVFVACGQVVEVKVGLHCDDCIKKILKAIKKIEGSCFSQHQYNKTSTFFFSFSAILLLCLKLESFADIETYNVDTKLNKVIVTGNVTTEKVIRVLQKIGKNAIAWEDDQSDN